MTQKVSAKVVFIAIVAALGGILFGYDTAVISGTTEIVKMQFGLTTGGEGWYVGCALIGSIAGVLIAGMLSDFLGRKKTMLISALLFSVSAIGCAVCDNFTQLVIYRMIGGFGIGIVSIVSPIYISEVSPANVRGTMVSLYQLFITIGFLLAYLANYLILKGTDMPEYWRPMLGAEAIPDLLFLILIFFIPESPRWLAVRGQRQDNSEAWKAMREKGILVAVLIGSAIAILGQFMGVNAVLYYGPKIFADAGFSDPLFSTVLVGVVNMLTTVIALIIIDKVGRKQLVWWGVGGMIVCLLALHAPSQLVHAHLLPAVCVLHGHIHQRRGVCAAERDVPQPGAGPCHVHRRPGAVGGNLSDWPAHALDAGEPHPGRHLLPLCLHVPPLPLDHVQICAGHHRKEPGRN